MATRGSSPEIDLGLPQPPPVDPTIGSPKGPPKLPHRRNTETDRSTAEQHDSPVAGGEVIPPPAEPTPPARKRSERRNAPKNAARRGKDDSDELQRGSSGLRGLSAAFVSAIVHLIACIVLAVGALPTLMSEGTTNIEVDVATQSEEAIDDFELSPVEASTNISVIDAQPHLESATQGMLGTTGAIGLDNSVANQSSDATALSDVSIDGPAFGMPSFESLIGEVPTGALGDPRAVVDGYDEALDRITQEILWMLSKSDVLAIWCFDQSESMKDDQREIRTRIARVYRQLGLDRRAAGHRLATAVTSYGQGFRTHTDRPTSDLGEIHDAIDAVPVDPSGKEMMCSAVASAIGQHMDHVKKRGRQMALILVTDETGEKPDNVAYLEATIAVAREARCRVYILGREAVFGYPYAHMKWKHPYTGHVHWLPVDRGPETAFVEQLQTDGFRRRFDAHPSGFGPYDQCRLARETGGIFFTLPSLESNIVRGEKRRYELEAMRTYLPDLRHRLQIIDERNNSALRSTLWKIINDLNPYDENVAKFMEAKLTFPARPDRFATAVRTELAKKVIYLNYLDRASNALESIRNHRDRELSPRWRANYDLIYAQLLAYTARSYEYGAYLEKFVLNPKQVPFEKPKFLRLSSWVVRHSPSTVGGNLTAEYVRRSTEMFQQIQREYAKTPWATRAQWELSRGFGFELHEHYNYYGPRAPTPNRPSTPRPKISIPKL